MFRLTTPSCTQPGTNADGSAAATLPAAAGSAITANYLGDTDAASSTSPSVTLTVNKTTIGEGGVEEPTLTVDPNPPAPGMPAQYVSFNPAQVTPGMNGTASMTVTVPPQKAELGTGGFGVKAPLALAALVLPLVAWRRRRTWGRLLMLLVLGLASSAAILGCAGGGTFVQKPQTYTFTVVGTSDCGGATQSSSQITLTVSM